MKRRSEDEASLFRASVGEVRRLPQKERQVERRKPPPRARISGNRSPVAEGPQPGRAGAVPALERGDPLLYARPGTPRTLLRELRRGRVRAEDALDLHGLSAARAAHALRDFLGVALAEGRHCVRVVHGKGLHSGQEGPVLKNLVDAVLRNTSAVRAFASATPAQGGLGAVNVLLDR